VARGEICAVRPGRATALKCPGPTPSNDPIKPPKGRPIVTLKDAAAYILKLSKSAQQSPEWQAAGGNVTAGRWLARVPRHDESYRRCDRPA
jgi:hypothetical protein